MKLVTLLFLRRDGQILLAMKKRGFGEGKWNGVGGKVEPGETARHGGVSSIAVLTGYNHPELLATAGPDLTVPDLGALRSLLERRQYDAHPIATVGALIHDGAGKLL